MIDEHDLCVLTSGQSPWSSVHCLEVQWKQNEQPWHTLLVVPRWGELSPVLHCAARQCVQREAELDRRTVSRGHMWGHT